MTSRPFGPARTFRAGAALAGVLAGSLACGAAGTARAAIATPAQAAADSLHQADVVLARAVTLWRDGDLHGAARLLAGLDLSPDSTFPRADRAAFLLAVLERRLGRPQAWRDQVAATADANSASPYRRWLAHLALWDDAATGGGASPPAQGGQPTPAGAARLPGAAELEASLLLEAGRPAEAADLLEGEPATASWQALHLHLLAGAAQQCGRDPQPALRRLADLPATDGPDAALVAAARLQLAHAELLAGRDGDERLRQVAADGVLGAGPWGAQAFRLLALTALARGDTAAALADLTSALVRPLDGPARRQALLERGALAGARGDRVAAGADYAAAAEDWRGEAAAVAAWGEPGNDAAMASAWSAWTSAGAWDTELRPSTAALDLVLGALAESALDLLSQPEADPARLLARGDGAAPGLAAPAASPGAASVHGPTNGELDRWRALRADLSRAEARRSELAHEVGLQGAERARRLDYLERGRRRAVAEMDSLGAFGRRLGALGPRLEAGLATLRALHDQALQSVAARREALSRELRRSALYAQAIRHFHAEGPADPRRADAATEAAAAAGLLGQEIELAGELEAAAAAMAEQAPQLLGRSLREAWEPRLVDGGRRLHAERDGLQAGATAIAAGLDTLRDRALHDAELARREKALADGEVAVSVAAAALQAGRAEIARAVSGRALLALAAEREGIDYHLADVAYWAAVAVATDAATADQPALAVPARELATARLDTFLARHPASAVLSEARFRRADLALAGARDAFRARMAGYLDHSDGRAARALAPFFDGGPAIALYEAILRDDPTFAHRDAVLFNLGMIKADSGDPDGLALLGQLVREHPQAAGVQDAWLRLGDDRFEARDYAACVGAYEHAAAGGDPALAAIALYKLGWARFVGDDFAGAALAFTRLLDLPASAPAGVGPGGDSRAGGSTALRAEAEEHLVQSLLRAGGAEAFAHHVEATGPRERDERVLAAMALLAAEYSLDEDAIACDELWLRRYPLRPGALAASERIVATLERERKPAAAVRARLELAPRFLPGSAWVAATDSAGLREGADRFARRAYAGAAAFEHQAARAASDTTAWARALGHYETHLAHWPTAAEAPRLEYQAGEAAGAVRRYARAVRHFEAAARCDTASFARDAAWQAVAVRDAWYRSTLAPGDGVGADSLATALLAAGDAFSARYPDDAHAAELSWRLGQLSYAHGRDADAARRLLAFAAGQPGDRNAVAAARLAGDAHYRSRDFAAAGQAYEQALALATAAGRREAMTELAALLPACAYEHASCVAAGDSARDGAAAAPLYLALATRWPDYEHATAALYRAGLGFAAAGRPDEAIAAWERILAGDARGAWSRDAAVRIAQAHEAAGRPAPASAAWVRVSTFDPDGEDAPAALLRAIDLREAAADTAGAEGLRDDYLKRFPGDLDTAFAIAEARARRELARAIRDGDSVAALAAAPVKVAKPGKGKAATGSAVRRYLDLAEAHPDHAATTLLAQVDYLAAEEALRAYVALPLAQPLPASLERKNRSLEAVVARFNRCAERGDAELAHAAAFRIGEAVIHLGHALLDSERPAGLVGDDLAAYEEVLREQSLAFTTRGEDAWAQLLRKADRAEGRDPGGWLARTEGELWPRLARRYVHRPELEYPLAAAAQP